jgi:hypothetical protein
LRGCFEWLKRRGGRREGDEEESDLFLQAFSLATVTWLKEEGGFKPRAGGIINPNQWR